MKEVQDRLAPFAKRVRWLEAWKGLAFGALVGGLGALVWAVLDWTRVAYADWRGLGIVVAVSAVAGAVVGFFRRTAVHDLAASIDRRAGLKDRLSTAIERGSEHELFDEALVQDAEKSLEPLKAAMLYPVTVGKRQIAALVAIVLAASVFLLGNSPVVRGPKTAAERAELKEMGQKIERVLKPLEKPVKAIEVPASQRKLAGELNKFARELEEGKLNKEEALRKANDLAAKAEEQAKDTAKAAQDEAAKTETALGKYEKMQLDEAGVTDKDLQAMNLSPEEQASMDQMMKDEGFQSPPSKFSDNELQQLGASRTAEKLAQLTPEQREKLRQAIAQRQKEVQDQIDKMDKMSPSERKALESQMAEMRKQQQELQKMADALKLSDEAMKALRDLMNSEEMKKLRETMAKMKAKASQMNQQGKPMTKEEMEQLKKELEDLAKALKDPKLKEQILQRIRDMQKMLESGQMTLETMQGMMSSMGLNGMDGSGAATQDQYMGDTGQVNKSEHEMETKGKTTATAVQGQWNQDKGDQWSVTVKAPTQVGNRSSVPYQKVLPQYRKSAEKALSSGKIPKDKEKRVKEYFESLSGGK